MPYPEVGCEQRIVVLVMSSITLSKVIFLARLLNYSQPNWIKIQSKYIFINTSALAKTTYWQFLHNLGKCSQRVSRAANRKQYRMNCKQFGTRETLWEYISQIKRILSISGILSELLLESETLPFRRYAMRICFPSSWTEIVTEGFSGSARAVARYLNWGISSKFRWNRSTGKTFTYRWTIRIDLVHQQVPWYASRRAHSSQSHVYRNIFLRRKKTNFLSIGRQTPRPGNERCL